MINLDLVTGAAHMLLLSKNKEEPVHKRSHSSNWWSKDNPVKALAPGLISSLPDT